MGAAGGGHVDFHCSVAGGVRVSHQADGSHDGGENSRGGAHVALAAQGVRSSLIQATELQFVTLSQVLRAQWQLLQQHTTEMKTTLPMLAHLISNFYSVSKKIPKSAGKSVFKDQIDDMLRSLFVEFPSAQSHDAWAAIVWCGTIYYPKPLTFCTPRIPTNTAPNFTILSCLGSCLLWATAMSCRSACCSTCKRIWTIIETTAKK